MVLFSICIRGELVHTFLRECIGVFFMDFAVTMAKTKD